MVYFGGVSGVCHDWQFDFWPYFHHALACVCTGFSASCTNACSWFTPLFFNNFWSKIKWHVWLIRRGLIGVQYIKVLKECIFVYSFPSLLLLGVYIFIIKQFELGSRTRDQSDHLALAPALAFFLVHKLTFFCENRQYLTQIQMEIFLVYFIRLIFTLNGWKLLRFVNVFVCLFSFRVRLKIAPVTWVFPDSYYAGSGAMIWQIRSTHLDAECSGHFQSTPRIY